MAGTMFIDFTAETISPHIHVDERVSHDGLIVSRLRLPPPTPGSSVSAAQFSMIMHEGPPFELAWRPIDRQHTERHFIKAGQFHLIPADKPIHVAWQGTRQVLAVAMTRPFIERTVGEAFGGAIPDIRARAALLDPAIEELAACLRRDMKATVRCSGLRLNFLGASLALHLFEAYGDVAKPPPATKGGLGMSRQRRVTDYIEAHLSGEIRLAALAQEAGLSPHHFGKAFKASLGKPPSQYLAERRITKAKELLLGTDRSITEVAYDLGFASHSHFTGVFRRITATTPSQYRQDRR